jgi:hypothetical protein
LHPNSYACIYEINDSKSIDECIYEINDRKSIKVCGEGRAVKNKQALGEKFKL